MANIMDENTKKPKKVPRIKHKKLIILFSVLFVAAAVFIIKGFTTKKGVLANDGDSFELEKPKTGSPADYSPNDNIAIAIWQIKHTPEFTTTTTGTVIAKVAMINYKQELKNTRIVTTDGAYLETISDSSLVHVYEEKYFQDGQVVIKAKDKYTTVLDDVYLESYGWKPNDFGAYIINNDTILESSMEQKGDLFYVSLVLDPKASVSKKQRETKKIANGNGWPDYESCELTLVLTSDWVPVELDTKEVYKIGMPGIGNITCHGDMVEEFKYGRYEIPGKDEFKTHIGKISDKIEDAEKDAIAYLQEIFGPLINGKMNDFKINIEALGNSFNGDVNIDLSSGIAVKADLEDIFVNYVGDDVYVKLGENKYKVSISKIKEYLTSTNSSELLNTDALMDQLNDALISKVDDRITLTIKLDLMGINLIANINGKLNDEKLYDLVDVDGALNINDEVIKLKLLIGNSHNYPSVDNSYNDITDCIAIVDEIKNLIDNTVEIKANATYENINFKIDALYENGTVSGIISIDDKYKVNIYYKDNIVYINYGDIKIKLDINNVFGLLEEFNIELPKLELNINDILDTVKTLSIKTDKNKIDLGIDLKKLIAELGILGININYSDGISLDINKYNIIASIKKSSSHIQSLDTKDYIDAKEFVPIAKDIMEMVKDPLSINVDASVSNINLEINALYYDKELNASAKINDKYYIDLYYEDDNLYALFNDIYLKSNITDILDMLKEYDLLDTSNINIDLDSIFKIIDTIKLTKLDAKKYSISIDLSTIIEGISEITLIADFNDGINLSVNEYDVNISINSMKGEIKKAPEYDYIDLNELKPLIANIIEAVNYEAYGFDINLVYDEALAVYGNVYLDKDLNVSAIVDVDYSGLKFEDIMLFFKDNIIYLSYGKLNIELAIDEINPLIERVCELFNLEPISLDVDSLTNNLDIDSLIDSLDLSIVNDSLDVKLDLSNITDIISDLELIISSDLGIEAKANDITMNASLSEEAYRTDLGILNVDYLDYDEILLILDYAKELADVVEHYRYNINFEMHVNGYGVYAHANIVTFKPEAGLSLYGKVILVQNENTSNEKYYFIEAYIIENIVYVEFSQTITNFNKNNPIESTTTQSIQFTISFNELIDTANIVLDGLGIENDTIEMLILYLGKIVNTNGDFDQLFDEISNSAKLDLTMISSMFDLSQIGISVDENKLEISLGNNKNNENQSILLLRDNGAISGLIINNLVINNDELDGEFYLLEDSNITMPSYSGTCLKLDGISRLAKAAINNYVDGEIEVSGSVNMSLLGLDLSAGVDLTAKIDLRDLSNIKAEIVLDVSKLGIDLLGLLIAANTKTYIYIENGNIYMKRVAKKTETRKMSLTDFSSDILEEVIWMLNFGSTVANAIRDAKAVEPKIEEVLTSYSCTKDSYSVTLDGPSLVGSNLFGNINGTLYTTNETSTIDDTVCLSKITAEATIISILELDATINVNKPSTNVDWSTMPSIETLEGYTSYQI